MITQNNIYKRKLNGKGCHNYTSTETQKINITHCLNKNNVIQNIIKETRIVNVHPLLKRTYCPQCIGTTIIKLKRKK